MKEFLIIIFSTMYDVFLDYVNVHWVGVVFVFFFFFFALFSYMS
jgi:hypothetical protein